MSLVPGESELFLPAGECTRDVNLLASFGPFDGRGDGFRVVNVHLVEFDGVNRCSAAKTAPSTGRSRHIDANDCVYFVRNTGFLDGHFGNRSTGNVHCP